MFMLSLFVFVKFLSLLLGEACKATLKLPPYGRWSQYACHGKFGGRRMIEALKAMSGHYRMLWKYSRGHKFSVKSYYKLLSGQQQVSFHWKSIWNTCLSSKVLFFN